MRIALINSGLGLLAAAAELHRLRPDADLVLAMDPDGMPWGPRTPADIAERSLAAARAAAAFGPDVLVFACNTGTVHALGALRAEFEPGIPVVGTVPAIKPAAAHSGSVAVWATVATTASAYQRQLIADFAGPARVTAVACPGLAEAVDSGDERGHPGRRGAGGRAHAGRLRRRGARLHRVRARGGHDRRRAAGCHPVRLGRGRGRAGAAPGRDARRRRGPAARNAAPHRECRRRAEPPGAAHRDRPCRPDLRGAIHRLLAPP